MPNHPEYPNIPLKEMLCLYDLDQTYDLVLPEKIGWWADYWTDAHWFFTPYVGSNVYGGILIDYFTPDMSPFADLLSNILYDWYLPWTGTDEAVKARDYIAEPSYPNSRVSLGWLEDIINPTIDWDNGIALTIALPAGEGTGTISYYIDESVSHWWLDRIKYASVCLNKRVIHYKLTSEPQTITIPIRTEGTFYAGYGSPIIGTFVVSGDESEAIKGSVPSFWLYESLPSILDSISQAVVAQVPWIFQVFAGYRVKSEVHIQYYYGSSSPVIPAPTLGGNWDSFKGQVSTSQIGSVWRYLDIGIRAKQPIVIYIYTRERPLWYRFCWLKTANNQYGQLVEREDKQTHSRFYYYDNEFIDSPQPIYKKADFLNTEYDELLYLERDSEYIDNYISSLSSKTDKYAVAIGRHRIIYDTRPVQLNSQQIYANSPLGVSGGSIAGYGYDIGAAGYGIIVNNDVQGAGLGAYSGFKSRTFLISATKNIRDDWQVYRGEVTITAISAELKDDLTPPIVSSTWIREIPDQFATNAPLVDEVLLHEVYDDVIETDYYPSLTGYISGDIALIDWETYLATQDLTIMVDSQRIKEIHAALQADKFAWMPNTTDTLRNANLGYYIERIARVLGISVKPDGSLRTIRPKKFIKAGETLPAGWYGGCFGLNNGGSTEGQLGGTPDEERDGIVYEIKCNNFDGKHTIESGGYALCENWIQYLDAMQDDLDKALGWQDLGAMGIKSADGTRLALYEGLADLIKEALFIQSSTTMNTSSTQTTAIATHQMVRELIRVLGIPNQEKFIPVDIGEDETSGYVNYAGYPENTPTLADFLFAILTNIGYSTASNMKVKPPQTTP